MLNTQTQSERTKAVLQVSCALCGDETENTIYINSVKETATPATIADEGHQTSPMHLRSSSNILCKVNNLKVMDVAKNMRSCLFGWSWRPASLLGLKINKSTPATSAKVKQLISSSFGKSITCNVLATSPQQRNLAEKDLLLRQIQICYLTARLCLVYRPECIVEVDCSNSNFQVIATCMKDIGLGLPIKSCRNAIMPSESSAVELVIPSVAPPTACCNHATAIDIPHETQQHTEYYELHVGKFEIQELTIEVLDLDHPDVQVADEANLAHQPAQEHAGDYYSDEFEGEVQSSYYQGVMNIYQAYLEQEDKKVQAIIEYHSREFESEIQASYYQGVMKIYQEYLEQEDQKVQAIIDYYSQKIRRDLLLHLHYKENQVTPAHQQMEANEAQTADYYYNHEIETDLPPHLYYQENQVTPAHQQVEANEVQTTDYYNNHEIETDLPPHLYYQENQVTPAHQQVEANEVQTTDYYYNHEIETDLPPHLYYQENQVTPAQVENQVKAAADNYSREMSIEIPTLDHQEVQATYQTHQQVEDQGSQTTDCENSEVTLDDQEIQLEVETTNKDPICSKFASMTCPNGISISDVTPYKNKETLKGSEIFFGKTLQSKKKNLVTKVVEKSLLTPPEQILAVLHELYPIPALDCNSNVAINNGPLRENQEDIAMATNRSWVEKDDVEQVCSLLASISGHEAYQSAPKNTFKGSKIFFGKTVMEKVGLKNENEKMGISDEQVPKKGPSGQLSTDNLKKVDVQEESQEEKSVPTTEGVPKQDDIKSECQVDTLKYEVACTAVDTLQEQGNVQNWDEVNDLNAGCQKTSEEVTFVSTECLLLPVEVSEAENSLPGSSSLHVVSQGTYNEEIPPTHAEQGGPVPSVEEAHKIQYTETFTAEPSVVPSHESNASPFHQPVKPKELSASEYKEEITAIVPKFSKETRSAVDSRRPKRSFSDTDNMKNQPSFSNVGVGDTGNNVLPEDQTILLPELEAMSKEKKRASLVTKSAPRYPNDVHGALMSQTVHLLERGIVILSETGSFKAIVNPSTEHMSRIEDALMGCNFSKNFKRYEPLPEHLKGKMIERAAQVAKGFEDRALGVPAEQPIFSLGTSGKLCDRRPIDCNGDYIMDDVSLYNEVVFTFTGIQQETSRQYFATPQMQQFCPFNDVEMLDDEEFYMDIDENIDDIMMECEDCTDLTACSICSKISLNLFPSLPSRLYISRRAIYSLLDERPLIPVPSSWKADQSKQKSWFDYNTFRFGPEDDEPSGSLSNKEKIIYSLLDQRPLNPVLPPLLEKKSKIKSWFDYNTFSFREGDLVQLGGSCNCTQTTQMPVQTAKVAVNVHQPAFLRTAGSTSKPQEESNQMSSFSFEQLVEQVANPNSNAFPHTTEQMKPSHPCNFCLDNHSPQQVPVVKESKEVSAFSFPTVKQRETKKPMVESSKPTGETFSFRLEDDKLPEIVTKEDNKDTNSQMLSFTFGREEPPVFPVGLESDSCINETERDEDDIFDLNDGTVETSIKEILAALVTNNEEKVKSKEFNTEGERTSFAKCDLGNEDANQTCSANNEQVSTNNDLHKNESTSANLCSSQEQLVTEISLNRNKLSCNVEPASNQAVDKQCIPITNKQNVDHLETRYEAKNKTPNRNELTSACKVEKSATGQRWTYEASQVVPRCISQAQENYTFGNHLGSEDKASHKSKTIKRRPVPYPTQDSSGLAPFLRRRGKLIDKRSTPETSSLVGQNKNEYSTSLKPVPAVPLVKNAVTSLKSLDQSKKTGPSSKPYLSLSIVTSDVEKRSVVSSMTQNEEPESKTVDTVSKSSLSTSPIPSSAKNLKDVFLMKSDATAEPSNNFSASKPRISLFAEESAKVVSSRSVMQSKKSNSKSKYPCQSPVSNEENRQVISLKSQIQTNKAQIKKSTPKPVSDAKNSKATSLKISTRSTDSMSNYNPRLPRLSSAVRNKVVSLNPMHQSQKTEPRSKLKLAPSDMEKNKVISLRSVTQCKKDGPLNKSVASLPHASPHVEDSCKEGTGMIISKDVSELYVSSFKPSKASDSYEEKKIISLKSVTNNDKEGKSSKSPSSKSTVSSELQIRKKFRTQSDNAVSLATTSIPTVPMNVHVESSKVMSLNTLTQNEDTVGKNNRCFHRYYNDNSIGEPSKSGKQQSCPGIFSSHKRDLDEMLEDDQESEKERIRSFRREGKLSSGVDRKEGARTKPVVRSTNKNVKLGKTDMAEDTSIAKRKSLSRPPKPLSFQTNAKLVNEVAKVTCAAKWIPGTLHQPIQSPQEKMVNTNADIRKDSTIAGYSQETPPQKSNSKLLDDAMLVNNVYKNAGNGHVKSSQGNTQKSKPTQVDLEIASKVSNNNTNGGLDKSCLRQPKLFSPSMELVKEPLSLAGIADVSGESKANREKIAEPSSITSVRLGKRKLSDMHNEGHKSILDITEKIVEVKRKRRWGKSDTLPEKPECSSKPRRIVRNFAQR